MMQPARTAWVLWRFIVNCLRYEPGRRVKVAGRYLRAVDFFAFHWTSFIQFHPYCGCAPESVKRRPLGREMLQITTPRFMQRSIFVTCDGSWTTIKSFEHEKPPRVRLCSCAPLVYLRAASAHPNRAESDWFSQCYRGRSLYQCLSAETPRMASDGVPAALHANIKSEAEVKSMAGSTVE